MTEALVNAINNPTSTLTASATSGASSLSVAAPSAPDAWAVGAQFRILIGTEIIVVTAASTSATTLTVVERGAENTTAAAHSSGADVNAVLTKSAIEEKFSQAAGAATGWFDDSGETWTYASGSGGGTATFTVNGDKTATFSPGTRVKLTQSATVKYFVVASSAVAAGTTTVTITAGSDYTLANSAISANFYSYASAPQGYPNAFNFAPVWAGFSVNPVAAQAVFSVLGRNVTVAIFLSAYGTSNATSLTFSVPITAQVRGTGPCQVRNSGVNQTGPGILDLPAGSATCAVGINYATGGGFTASGSKAADLILLSYLI